MRGGTHGILVSFKLANSVGRSLPALVLVLLPRGRHVNNFTRVSHRVQLDFLVVFVVFLTPQAPHRVCVCVNELASLLQFLISGFFTPLPLHRGRVELMLVLLHDWHPRSNWIRRLTFAFASVLARSRVAKRLGTIVDVVRVSQRYHCRVQRDHIWRWLSTVENRRWLHHSRLPDLRLHGRTGLDSLITPVQIVMRRWARRWQHSHHFLVLFTAEF